MKKENPSNVYWWLVVGVIAVVWPVLQNPRTAANCQLKNLQHQARDSETHTTHDPKEESMHGAARRYVYRYTGTGYGLVTRASYIQLQSVESNLPNRRSIFDRLTLDFRTLAEGRRFLAHQFGGDGFWRS